MTFRAPVIASILLGLVATGCASGGPRRWAGALEGMPAPLFVSPAGKVFRAPVAERPMEAWFREADADRDGALTFAEFRDDFARAFAGFDLDHDGEIEPEEVTHYETVTLPEMASRGGRFGGGAGASMRGRGGGMGRPAGGRGGMRGAARPGMGGGRLAMMSGAARFGLLPISHPLWDADADMNRGVSRAEFERAAGQRFLMLDTARTGRLSLADLASQRMGRRGRGGPRARQRQLSAPSGRDAAMRAP